MIKNDATKSQLLFYITWLRLCTAVPVFSVFWLQLAPSSKRWWLFRAPGSMSLEHRVESHPSVSVAKLGRTPMGQLLPLSMPSHHGPGLQPTTRPVCLALPQIRRDAMYPCAQPHEEKTIKTLAHNNLILSHLQTLCHTKLIFLFQSLQGMKEEPLAPTDHLCMYV